MQGDRTSLCRSIVSIAGKKSHDIGGCGLMGLGEKIASLILRGSIFNVTDLQVPTMSTGLITEDQQNRLLKAFI